MSKFYRTDKYLGTFQVIGTLGSKLAIPYLNFLETSDTQLIFNSFSSEEANKEIDSVVYPLISSEEYESINLKMEKL